MKQKMREKIKKNRLLVGRNFNFSGLPLWLEHLESRLCKSILYSSNSINVKKLESILVW